YYYTVGEMHSRPDRGLLSRPTVAEIRAYSEHVDDAMEKLLKQRADDVELAALVTLGLHHEQQHQELLLTDIKQLFFANPLGPAYRSDLKPPRKSAAPPMSFIERAGGICEVGAKADDDAGNGSFCFDNETPR